MSDDLPRLPPRPASDPPTEQLQLDLASNARRAAALRDVDWPPFHDPELVSLKWSRRAIVFARLFAFAWAIAVVITAVQAREDALAGRSDQASIRTIGVLGIVVAALVAVTGWYWSDQVTRNVHRLAGRLPTHRRCLTAWVAPLVWSAVLALTVVRIEPGDLLDVRPMIVVPIIALAVWRPYSLVRRIFTTLSRLSFDSIIGTGYVLELSGFGLIWWQVATWPDTLTPGNVGTADVLIGVGSAAAIGFGANVFVWTLVLAHVEVAQFDRMLTLRTRHDHRHLRLRGIDPMDADVRWALLKIHQEEELERLAAAERASVPEPTRTTTAREPAPLAEPPPATTATTTTEYQIAASPEIQSPDVPSADVEVDQTPAAVTELLSSADGEEIIAELVGEIAISEPSARIIAELADEVESESPPPIATQPVADPLPTAPPADAPITPPEAIPEVVNEPSPALARADQVPTPEAARPAAVQESDLTSKLRARLRTVLPDINRPAEAIDPDSTEARAARLAMRLDMAESTRRIAAPPTSSSAAPAIPADVPPSLASRLSSLGTGGTDDASSRIDRFAQRFSDSGSSQGPPRSLLQRLEEFGITPTVGPDQPTRPPVLGDDMHYDEERWIPPRLYALEAARYALLLAMVATVATSAWIVVRAVSVGGELTNGDIAQSDVDEIDLARRAFVTALGIVFCLVSLWCAIVASHARRAGVPDTREWHCYAGLFVATGLNVFAFVADGDERGTLSLLCLMGSLLTALWSVATVVPIARWFERRTRALTFWVTGLPLLVVMSWAGGLQQPIDPTNALEALTFVSSLQTIVAGIVFVLAALNTSDVENAIRVSPELAEPAPVKKPAVA